jgi:hypothetical protein
MDTIHPEDFISVANLSAKMYQMASKIMIKGNTASARFHLPHSGECVCDDTLNK